ncbi:MAG: S-layer homology domain-containing protein, partial [Anaerotignum sp.]|nr:S-layer homology domain-containing protein [Anaerotignum sp.]
SDDFAYIYAYAGAVEGKYPAAIARYGVNITWTALASQDLSWNDSGENLNAIYGDTVTAHTAVNNTSGGGAISYSSSNTAVATVDSNSGAVTINGAGTTTIAATAAEVDGEYNSSSISYTLTVGKKGITVSADSATKAYGEANPAFTFQYDSDDFVSEDDVDDLAVTLTTAATNTSSVGDYDITGTSTSAKYNVTVTPGTLTITKASEPTVSDITKNLLYSEAHTDVVVNITGLPSGSGATNFSVGAAAGDTAIINGAVTSTATGIQFSTNIGITNQMVTIPVIVTMENYEDTTVNVIVTLVDKTPVTITGVTVANKTYDGVAVSYEGTPSNEDGYVGEYEYVWSSGSAPKDAGDYTLTVKIPDDNETYMGELVIPFNIAKKALTVKPNNITIKKGASLPTTFALDYVGLISGDTISPSGTPEFALKNGADALANSSVTGNYTIEWTNKDAVTIEHPSYNITKADGTITIKKKSSSDDSTGGGGATPSTSATPKQDDTNTSVDAQTKTTNGAATASVSGDAVKNAIEAAEKAAGENKVEIKAAVPSGTKEIAFSVPRDSLQNFAESKAETLSLVSEIGEITMNTETAASIVKQAGSGNVNMSIAPVDKEQLNEQQRGAVGDAPIYDISVTTQGNKISSFDGGTITVSLPYELKEGEDPSNVVVWYLDAQGDIQKVESAYDKATGKVVFTTNHLSLYVVGYEAEAWKNPFADVAEDAWYFDAVQFANEQGLMSGTSTTKFSPESTTTRGMLVAILYRMENSPSARAASFTDVSPNAWYANAVEWAVENNIASGYSGGQFGPEDTITREQMAVILMNYAKLKGYDTNTDGNSLSAFADQSKVSPWAFDAMEWAVSQELIAGKTTTNLDPNGSATRSQIAAILMRLSKHQEM